MEQNHQVIPVCLKSLLMLQFWIYFGLLKLFWVYFQKRAFDYFTQAANAGNTHAMAFLGKVSGINE